MTPSGLKWVVSALLMPGLLFLGCAGTPSEKSSDGPYINALDKKNTERDRNERRSEILEGLD